MVGHTILRTIHYIVGLRTRYPDSLIWIRKEDLKSAYRRMHLDEVTAVRSEVRVILSVLIISKKYHKPKRVICQFLFSITRIINLTPSRRLWKIRCFYWRYYHFCTVDKGGNLDRIRAAPCTILNDIAHRSSSKLFVKKDNSIEDAKNEAKGDPEELKYASDGPLIQDDY